jgi:hypothetical protein
MATETPTLKSRLAQLVREPLLQFLAMALLLFAADAILNDKVERAGGERITVSAGRVQQLADSYALLVGRPPGRAELDALLADFIDEEIAYREAIAMGLDVDDTIVRRRMRQKLMFLVEDSGASEMPDEQALANWLVTHADAYRLPARLAFRQVLTSADRHGSETAVVARQRLAALNRGADPVALGDASMLPQTLPLTTRDGVASLFGDEFAASLFADARDGWFGPVTSPFGAHIVQVLKTEAARDPSLDEVRNKLQHDWVEAQRNAAIDAYRAELRDRYEVTVEGPASYADAAYAQHEAH